jgi:4-alpha-glucanotransferase
VLSLGPEARLNTPGRSGGNWRWRLRRGQLTDELAARLRAVTRSHGR